MLHCATLLVTCLAIVLMLSRNWELFSNSAFLLAAQQTYCETSCKRDVTLCNGEKMCCSVAAIVAKSRTWFYFVQCFLQQKCCVNLWLRGMLHLAISLATCVATKLRDTLRHKLHSVPAPLIALFVEYPWCFILCHNLRLHKLKNCGIAYLKKALSVSCARLQCHIC